MKGREEKILTVPIHALHLISGAANDFISNTYEWEILGLRFIPLLDGVTYSQGAKKMVSAKSSSADNMAWQSYGSFPYWFNNEWQLKTRLFVGAHLTRIRDVDSV